MKITSINVKPVNPAPETGMVARLSMTIDNAIALRGLRLIRREDGTMSLRMASQRRRNDETKYDELFNPINSDCRKCMQDAAVAAYEAAIGESDEQDHYIYDLDKCELDEALNITQIRVYLTKRPDARRKAFVSVVLDNEFVLHQMQLVELATGGMLLGMPSFEARKGQENRVNIYHPISAAARIKLTEAVLAKYEEVKAEKAAAEAEEA